LCSKAPEFESCFESRNPFVLGRTVLHTGRLLRSTPFSIHFFLYRLLIPRF
jgi:hypothetical protein